MMVRKRAGTIRTELAKIWEDNPLASSRDVVAKFKKLFGVTPEYDLADVVDYGLMEIAGQIAKTPSIDADSPEFFDAIQSNPLRKGIKKIQVFLVREGGVVRPRKFVVDDLTPEIYRRLDIVDEGSATKKKSPTQRELVEAEISKMEESGMNRTKFREFMLKGG